MNTNHNRRTLFIRLFRCAERKRPNGAGAKASAVYFPARQRAHGHSGSYRRRTAFCTANRRCDPIILCRRTEGILVAEMVGGQ